LSAVFPDDAPPRLWRFVESAAMPHPDVVAMLDKKNNVLRVNRDLFDTLDRDQQKRVMRTHFAIIELDAIPT